MKSKIAAISIITKAEASRLEASAEAAAIVADGIVVERDGALWAIGWLDASGPLPAVASLRM